jgi:peptidyl-prolyl cis-trans isomerase C
MCLCLLKGDGFVKIKKGSLIIGLLALVVLIIAGCGENVVATVNGEKITRDQLTLQVNELKSSYEEQGIDFNGDNGQTLINSLEKDTLDQMIDTKIMLQEARKIGKLEPQDIQEKIQPLREQFPAEAEYNTFLSQVKLSEEDVAYVLYLQDEVTKDVAPVSEEELRKYYDENQEQFSQPEQLEVRHILFFVDDGTKGLPTQHTDAEARKMAEDVVALLDEGRDFAELAKEKSEDSGTKAEGGLYTASESGTVPEFYAAASALSVGEYTAEPVKTDYGYHVIKLEKIMPATVEPFDQVKDLLAEELSNTAKQEKFNQYMQEARDKAVIVNKLEAK